MQFLIIGFPRGFQELKDEMELPLNEDLENEFEKENKLPTDWTNVYYNQKLIIDWFFNHIQPESSLCFFYAKKVPFVEDQNRIIVGVGRVKEIGPDKEYDYSHDSYFRGLLWERPVKHSIRPDFEDDLFYHIMRLSSMLRRILILILQSLLFCTVW